MAEAYSGTARKWQRGAPDWHTGCTHRISEHLHIMHKKHIGLIYAGGTVGMEQTAHGYAPMRDFPVVQQLLHDHDNSLPHYTLHAYPTPIDSANATPADWQQIARDIAARYDAYDGFVVLHGTDTMAWTAAALSFMLRGLRKPVIVTGSQIPLGAARSDAPQNLITALQLAASDRLSEVAIYFNQRLLRGNRATKVSAARFDAFDSPNYPPLAEVGIDIQWNPTALLPRGATEAFELPDYPQGTILPLRFVPGITTDFMRAVLDLRPQALILQCYGSGNMPDRDPAMTKMLARAHEAGTVLVACSQALHGQVTIGAYAAGAGMGAAGVIGAADMGFEAIFAKLHHLFALGYTPEQVRVEFPRNVAGELTA
jgi:L-asparaginase